MIVDTSAIMAIVLREPNAEALSNALIEAKNPKMAAPTLVELQAVLSHKGEVTLTNRTERLLHAYEITIEPFSVEHADIAGRAYRDYGRPSGHPAALNLGDCFSYALAYANDEPLLFVGQDFIHTDITPALVLPLQTGNSVVT